MKNFYQNENKYQRRFPNSYRTGNSRIHASQSIYEAYLRTGAVPGNSDSAFFEDKLDFHREIASCADIKYAAEFFVFFDKAPRHFFQHFSQSFFEPGEVSLRNS